MTISKQTPNLRLISQYMIKGKKVLAVIPARGGSKGVPRKNIRVLGDKPLICWTIDSGLASRFIDRLVVSTDDPEIANISRKANAEVPFLRPRNLAKDDTPGIAPILHSMERCRGFDIIVVLQPTSPFRDARNIDEALELMIYREADSCFSLVKSKIHPNWMKKINGDDLLEPYEYGSLVTSRQLLPPVYSLNGAIYAGIATKVMEAKSFHMPNSVGYIMPPDQSVDIDSELDFTICEAILNSSLKKSKTPTKEL